MKHLSSLISLLLFATVAFSQDFKKVFSDNRNSVVKIQTDTGVGSGFFINQFGVVLTCYHVVENAKKIQVINHDGSVTYVADLLNYWKDKDQAILLTKLSEYGGVPNTPFVRVYMNENNIIPVPMDDIIAIGYPLGIGLSVNQGKISAVLKNNDMSIFQTDCAINPGNSGGPIFDRNGYVVGIATSKINSEEIKNVSGMNYINSIDWLISECPFIFQYNLICMIKKYHGLSINNESRIIAGNENDSTNLTDLVIYNIFYLPLGKYLFKNNPWLKDTFIYNYNKDQIITVRKEYSRPFYSETKNKYVKDMIFYCATEF